MSRGVLVDLTRCIGCRSCQVACKAWNDNPGERTICRGYYDNPPHLSAYTWSIIHFNELEEKGGLQWVFTKRQCMHCQHPGCVSACPVGALHRLKEGAVVYESFKCIGCRYCMMACPFRIPKFDGDTSRPLIRKCTFCWDRQVEGLEPACVKACPTDALIFGVREALIAGAKKRIRSHPNKYINHIYGEKEVGGTSWMYLSPVPFKKIGFPALDCRPVTSLSETLMVAHPGIIVAAVAALSGIHWLTSRRGKLQDEISDSPKGET